MKIKGLLAIALAAFSLLPLSAAKHYVGGDISLLDEYEKAGAKYKDQDNKPIADLVPWLAEQGMNAMRIRVFVNPSDYTGSDKDPNACQTIESVTPLCKRIVDAGMDVMLDFHYSDFWADPAKQYTPKAWANLTDEELYQKIYDYTKESLQYLKEHGVVPAFIQPGNEISYGMLWGPEGTPRGDQKKCVSGNTANWDRFGKLLTNAIKACREECPDAKIILHTERITNVPIQTNFYNQMKNMNIDYDIVGLSYYPYFHGNLSNLNNALVSVTAQCPDKEVMIVETGYSYKWEVPGTTHDNTKEWPYTLAGQDKFVKDLVAKCEEFPAVTGIFWWWMEYNAYGTSLGGWYNAPLFDSTTGKATPALKTLCSFADDDTAVDGIYSDENAGEGQWFNIQGQPVANPSAPGMYVRRGQKIIVK